MVVKWNGTFVSEREPPCHLSPNPIQLQYYIKNLETYDGYRDIQHCHMIVSPEERVQSSCTSKISEFIVQEKT